MLNDGRPFITGGKGGPNEPDRRKRGRKEIKIDRKDGRGN